MGSSSLLIATAVGQPRYSTIVTKVLSFTRSVALIEVTWINRIGIYITSISTLLA